MRKPGLSQILLHNVLLIILALAIKNSPVLVTKFAMELILLAELIALIKDKTEASIMLLAIVVVINDVVSGRDDV